MNKKSLSARHKSQNKIIKFLNNKKIFKIYSDFCKEINKYNKINNLAVAVSGGPDSMALVFFAKCLSLKTNVKCHFFLVDHGLRKNSNKEAKSVISLLKKYEIFCRIIRWKGKKPKSNIHHYARYNRYDLIFKKCKIMKIDKLLIGHHADDLIENFFIRLFRGSGLKGLSSFGSDFFYENRNIRIIRPLLKYKKEDLEFVSKSVFKSFVKDPSNINEQFTRSRIRKFLKNENFNEEKLILTLQNLKKSNQAIEYYVKKNIDENCIYLKKKNTFILSNKFFKNSEEILFRSLNFIFTQITEKNYPPRGKKTLDLISRIDGKKFKKTTLGGCCIEKINKTLIIYKEK